MVNLGTSYKTDDIFEYRLFDTHKYIFQQKTISKEDYILDVMNKLGQEGWGFKTAINDDVWLLCRRVKKV